MKNEAYPILFKNVFPGDLKAIHRIFNEAHITQPNSIRAQFESQLREMLSLEDTVSLRGFV